MTSSGRAALLATVTEKAWQAQMEAWAKRGGWLTYHTRNSFGSAKGFPDLVAVRGTEVLWIELKTETGKLMAAQETWRDALILAGQRWYLWRPSMEAEVKQVLFDGVASRGLPANTG